MISLYNKSSRKIVKRNAIINSHLLFKKFLATVILILINISIQVKKKNTHKQIFINYTHDLNRFNLINNRNINNYVR